MFKPVVLWVDLNQREHGFNSSNDGNLPYRIFKLFGAEDLNEILRSVRPHVLCFEFDHPHASALAMLTETRSNHPSIPLLMIVEAHSEALAVWALRARVWDYFIKPATEAEIWQSITPLFENGGCEQWRERVPRNLIRPKHDPLEQPSQTSLSHAEKAILRAREYIQSHVEEKISEPDMAKFCGLSTSCFSRTFKRINGLTFSGFVLQARVNKAMTLLEDKHIKVTAVCYEAGFRNPSHFSYMFRRCVGVSPAAYRDRLRQNGVTLQSRGTSEASPQRVSVSLAQLRLLR